jgi:hypothetical protein
MPARFRRILVAGYTTRSFARTTRRRSSYRSPSTEDGRAQCRVRLGPSCWTHSRDRGPCPWLSCRHNLALFVDRQGCVQLTFPEDEPDEQRATRSTWLTTSEHRPESSFQARVWTSASLCPSHFDNVGVPRCRVNLNSPNRRIRTRTSGGVRPLCRFRHSAKPLDIKAARGDSRHMRSLIRASRRLSHEA